MPIQQELILNCPSTSTPPPSKPGRERSSEQQWLDWAANEWCQYRNRPMTVRWARDLALIKPLLRLHGEDELKARWRAHVRSMDEYIARKGWNIPSFSESVDRYAGDRDVAEAVRDLNLRRRAQRSRY